MKAFVTIAAATTAFAAGFVQGVAAAGRPAGEDRAAAAAATTPQTKGKPAPAPTKRKRTKTTIPPAKGKKG